MDVKAVAILASLFAAAAVTAAGLLQPPMYEATSQVRVERQQGDQQIELLANQAGSGEMIKTLPPKGAGLQAIILALTHAIDTRPVAEEATKRLSFEVTEEEILDNLRARQVENTNFISLTYEGTNLPEAAAIANTMANVSSERISEAGNLTATVYQKARVPDYPTPVSPKPLRNGLLTLVIGLALSAALIAGHSWLRLRRS